MSKDNNKIVDLEMSVDGTYSPKNTNPPKSVCKKQEPTKQNKYGLTPEADEFLGGLDAGLDFVEQMKIRAIRIIGLRD